MSPDRDTEEPEREGELYEEEAPRSIFSAMWFRAVLVVLVLGVIGVVAVPYLLDLVSAPPRTTPMKSTSRTGAPAPPAAVPAPAPAPPSETQPAAPPVAPVVTATPAAPPATSPALAAKTTEPAKPGTPPGAKTETPKAATPAAKHATSPAKPASTMVAKATTVRATAGGSYFVQVGAFKDAATAKRLASRLREQRYPVAESVTHAGSAAAAPAPAAGPSAGDRYDVFVTGGSPVAVNEKVASKGLAAESVAGGVVVKPSLPLRDAVALSKDLATEGLKVQVRRATAGAAASRPAPAAASAGGGETLYRVRVGGFPDRATAMTALRELEGKGYKPFLARGNE